MELKNLIKKTILILIIICSLIAVGCDELADTVDPPSEEDPEEEEEEPENDFVQITGSGYITLSISGLDDDEVSGHTIMYGASGIPSGGYERVGSSDIADSGTKSLLIKNETDDYKFTGGDVVGLLGCIIDVNGNYLVDDGDYLGGVHDYKIDGNATVSLVYPDDFTEISGSGYISLSVSGLDSFVDTGAELLFGASGILSGEEERIGNNMSITEPVDLIPLTDDEGEAVLFTGGDSVALIGCIIDVNVNHIVDDGDYLGAVYDHLIDGDETIPLVYPADFIEVTGSGYITLEVTGLSSFDGIELMYGAAGILSGGADRIGDSAEINSTTMSKVLSNEGENYLFTGGLTVGAIGCVIDANDNGEADDGDWFGGIYGHEMDGSEVLTLNYNPQ